MNTIKYSLLMFFLVACVCIASAQTNKIDITGTIVESESLLPVGYATIIVADKTTDKTISGTVTDENGQFSFSASTIENAKIKISFIGFETKEIENFTVNNQQVNLGEVKILQDVNQLEAVVVEGEKSQTVFQLDKRVFNVGSDLSSTGASALEILNNVPSVNVNIEGQISLRGSTGVQMLINGKPSVLASEEGGALGSITADMIEKIEVITNPSAKYDAEGTSGIINIVLKKSEKQGLNGSVTLNTGVPNNHSIGLSLNRRTEKFNLFSQIGYGKRTFPRENKSSNLNKIANTTLSSAGESDKNEQFFNLILGTDYHINKFNVLTLSGHYAFEDEKENSAQLYQLLNATSTVSDSWNRNERTTATNPKWEYELQYKKDFEDHKEHSLLFSALGNSFGKDKTSNFANTTILGSNENTQQQANTNFSENEYVFKLDYIHPFLEKYTIETGSQYLMTDVKNDYEIRDFENNAWAVNQQFTNVFEYNQNVLGVYGTFAYEGEKWGVKGGLRLENTDLNTTLVNTNQTNDQNYTNLFPSMHTSYKATENVSFQAGYSKRIYRPGLWSLNPFTSFRDNFNVYTGNPNLKPEYTDSYEISSIYDFSNGSLNFGVYHRATDDIIERIVDFNETTSVSTSRPENIGTNNSTGFEINAEYSPTNQIMFTSDTNINTFKRKGQFATQNFDFNGNQWNTRLIGKFKLPADFTAEATGIYRSKVKTVQGQQAENTFMNFGLRKKMMKGRLNASLSIRDVFETRKYESFQNQTNFYRTSNSQSGRFVTLGVSYGFGKGEAMEFSGQKRF